MNKKEVFMKNLVSSIVVLFVGFFTLLMGLILAIPLTVLALVTGKKLQRRNKVSSATDNTSTHGTVLEGEYEEVSK